MRDEEKGLLFTDGDQQLIGSGPYAPPGQQFGSNFLDESGIIDVAIVKRPLLDFIDCKGEAAGFPPFRDREERSVIASLDEGKRVFLPIGRAFISMRRRPRAAQETRRRSGLSGPLGTGDQRHSPVWCRRLGYIDTRTLPRLQMSLGDQLLIGEENRIARHAQLTGQFPRGRQFAPGRKYIRRYRLHHTPPDLLLQGQAQSMIDPEKRGVGFC